MTQRSERCCQVQGKGPLAGCRSDPTPGKGQVGSGMNVYIRALISGASRNHSLSNQENSGRSMMCFDSDGGRGRVRERLALVRDHHQERICVSQLAIQARLRVDVSWQTWTLIIKNSSNCKWRLNVENGDAGLPPFSHTI